MILVSHVILSNDFCIDKEIWQQAYQSFLLR